MKNSMDSDTLLRRHQNRREDRIPTVSVLTGAAGLAITAWRRFVTEQLKRPVIQLTHPTWEDWLDHWTHPNEYQNSIPQITATHLASILNRNPEELQKTLQGKTKTEIDLFTEANLSFAGAGNDPENILTRIGLHCLTHGPMDWDIPKILQREANKAGIPLKTLFRTLYDWASDQAPALLWFSPQKHEAVPELLANEAHFCAEIVQCIPACPIAWVIASTAYECYLENAPESRTKVLCRENVVAVQSLSASELEKQISGVPMAIQSSIQRLVRDGVDQPLADMFIQTANALDSPNRDQARSAAEAFLHTRLESLPETTGLFSLNQRIEVPWGERSCMEIDLLSRQYRIAIEIDGYYHFQDPDAYRRDRRKDYGLQCAGYFVLRFLADDTVSNLENILDTVHDCVRKRRKENTT